MPSKKMPNQLVTTVMLTVCKLWNVFALYFAL